MVGSILSPNIQYIPLIYQVHIQYCLLGGYRIPTTYYQNQNNPMILCGFAAEAGILTQKKACHLVYVSLFAMCEKVITLPETSETNISLKDSGVWETKFLLGKPIFRCYVTSREGMCCFDSCSCLLAAGLSQLSG